MLIPMRCFTCGKMLSDKYRYYQNELVKKKLALKSDKDPLILDLNVEEIKKTPAGEIMDELGLTRKCCRKSVFTCVDLINEI